jgi:type VI secretion system protein ImpC
VTTKPSLFGQIRIGVSEAPQPAKATPDTPFRMLILGDFSGRGSRGVQPDARRVGGQPTAIDRDLVDEVFAKLGVEIALPVGEGRHEPVRFGALDELHPDHIVDQLGVFAELRALRRRLLNPDSFAAAAQEVSSWTLSTTRPEPAPPKQLPPASRPSQEGIPLPDDLLDAALAASAEESADLRSRTGSDLADRLIREIVAPHVLPAPDPRQDELVAAVDTATAAQLQAILHDPDFQAVESGWRALDFLVRRLETGSSLKLYLLDLSKADLAADLSDRDQLAPTSLYKLLVEQALETPGGQPWSLLVGNYTFDTSVDDADLLGRLARVAARAGAPLLAGGAAPLVGCPSFATAPDPEDWTLTPETHVAQAWAALRALPEADHLGLFLPRVLQRLPYGARSNPIEAFGFEEIPEGADAETRHRAYLWGNSAFAAACLMGQAFNADGWSLRPGLPSQLDGMPLHVTNQDGEPYLLPCAEIWLSERGAEQMLNRGLTPVWSVKNQDCIRIGPFRSLAGNALRGRWST